jgi:hypothetical protein
MTMEVRLLLNDDETADHEARRLIMEALNRGANFFTEETQKPLLIFKDHKCPISDSQLLNASRALCTAADIARKAARKHTVEPTFAQNQGMKGEALAALKQKAQQSFEAVSSIAMELQDAWNLVNKWRSELMTAQRALKVGAAAIAAMGQ